MGWANGPSPTKPYAGPSTTPTPQRAKGTEVVQEDSLGLRSATLRSEFRSAGGRTRPAVPPAFCPSTASESSAVHMAYNCAHTVHKRCAVSAHDVCELRTLSVSTNGALSSHARAARHQTVRARATCGCLTEHGEESHVPTSTQSYWGLQSGE